MAYSEDSFDVLVVGGGLSGICAAIQSARLGANTALVERELVLGGASNSNFRLHIEGANYAHGEPRFARETGIIEELEAEALKHNAYMPPVGRMHGYFNSMWSEILRLKCEESGVRLFLKTVVKDAKAENGKILSVSAYDMLSHKERTFTAEIYVDASGDGCVALPAGAKFRMGREAKTEFNETFAPDEADNRMMGHALIFHMRNAGRPIKYVPPPGTPVFNSVQELPMFYISEWDPKAEICPIWTTEWGGHLDTMMDDEVIYKRLLANVHGLTDFLKNRGDYGAENYELYWISEFIGKREGRRFIGDHILTQGDLFSGGDFEDAVAYGGRSVDLHEVTDDGNQYKVVFYGNPPLYGIPFRCLYSANIENLMLAGRLISGTRVALGSYRVMKTLSTIGQAVGAGAFLCKKYGVTPREIGKNHIEELRQLLLKEDATILNAVNNDPNDFARNAEARAISETPDGPAANAINGVNRQFWEKPTNMWISLPGLPQHLDLYFDKPKQISQVQATFDTCLRENRGTDLTMSAFPHTVRDYTILCRSGGNWIEMVSVKGNYQRFRRHVFEPINADAVRINVEATNGVPEARIFEVRVY